MRFNLNNSANGKKGIVHRRWKRLMLVISSINEGNNVLLDCTDLTTYCVVGNKQM